MRQHEEQELDREVRRELEALDRALAGEPVDAELDAVAILARELRASRPEPSPEFAEELDERAAAGFAPDGPATSPFARRVREWLTGARPMRMLAPAGAIAVVVLVTSVAVIRTGDGGDATTPLVPPGQEQEVAAGDEAAPPVRGAGIAPNAPEREVERSATLALSTDGDEFEQVSDGVVEITDRYKGFVISSEERSAGETSRATFELEIPSDRLQDAVADLSELAHVEARTEDALDITAPTIGARQHLADARTEVVALRRQLAESDTPDEARRIRRRLELARGEVAASRQDVRRLTQRANYADVRVTVTSDRGASGDWGADDAVDEIGDALSVAGGVALISAAILLPVGLLVALVGLLWRRSIDRRRERALGD